MRIRHRYGVGMGTNYENYSVLMSVYYKENPEQLSESLESILNQTVKTNDFVLVCDGPLNEELDGVIDEYQSKFGGILNVVRLPENGGLGKALNEGMKHCKDELIGRMDSDDISYPDRFERQLRVFREYPEIAICSGIVEEFENSISDVTCKRVVPEKHEDILAFSKKRNPFNHPCVMYKKSKVEEAGGYMDFPLLEDYYLWVRMLKNGAIGYNIQEPILWMRAGNGMYERRAGWKYVISQKRFFDELYKAGYISLKERNSSVITRAAVSLIPNIVRKKAFKVMVRK